MMNTITQGLTPFQIEILERETALYLRGLGVQPMHDAAWLGQCYAQALAAVYRAMNTGVLISDPAAPDTSAPARCTPAQDAS